MPIVPIVVPQYTIEKNGSVFWEIVRVLVYCKDG